MTRRDRILVMSSAGSNGRASQIGVAEDFAASGAKQVTRCVRGVLVGTVCLGQILLAACATEPTHRSSSPHALATHAEPVVPVREARQPGASAEASSSTASAGKLVARALIPSKPSSETVPVQPDNAGSLRDPGLANVDPEDDSLVAPPDPIPDCEERLRAAGVRFKPAKLPIVRRRGFECGAHQVVQYLEGPEHIRFTPPALVTCQLALALAHFESVLQRASTEYLGVKVRSIVHGGTYNCRSMARFRLVSEHSYANAIDLKSLGLVNGRSISVLEHFGRPSLEARSKESRFLRTLAQRSFDEDVFSVVVTRYFDELHADHIHVDMAHYRTDGTR